MSTQSKHTGLRYAALALSILVILAVAILAIPSARSFAQSLIQQIGGYVFAQGTPEPYDASRVPGSMTIVRSPESVSIEFTGPSVAAVSDPAEAATLAGFTVLAPAYLPDGYISSTNDWHVIHEGNGTVVVSGYHNAVKDFFFLSQWKPGDGEIKSFTREEIVDVTVRGRSGVWLPETSSPRGNKALVWEENGITCSLISDSLSLDEMLKIAESLGQ